MTTMPPPPREGKANYDSALEGRECQQRIFCAWARRGRLVGPCRAEDGDGSAPTRRAVARGKRLNAYYTRGQEEEYTSRKCSRETIVLERFCGGFGTFPVFWRVLL